jgi:tRNA (guanine-N7-)-methyltransferase
MTQGFNIPYLLNILWQTNHMSKQNTQPILRKIKSFVKRQGRLTIGQAKALTDDWQQYGRSVEQGPLVVKDVFANNNHLIFEIGFGNGQSLVSMALATPDYNYLGIEVHRPGVGMLLRGIEAEQLTNIRIYQEDAIDVLEQCIPDHSLSRVQLYFPDPWPKKKHHKRRIVQPEFAALIHRKLCAGGVFHMATDWQNYAEHMLAVMDAAPGFSNQAGQGNYSPKPAYRPTTKFEQRGQKLGHGVWDLLYVRS